MLPSVFFHLVTQLPKELDEQRSFWKYTQIQAARNDQGVWERERITYHAKLKIKLLGEYGDARCYCNVERADSGALLYHVIEYEQKAH